MPVTTDVNSSRLWAWWTLIDSGCECVCACAVSSACNWGSLWVLEITLPPLRLLICALFGWSYTVQYVRPVWKRAKLYVCVCVFVLMHQRAGCSSDSRFADRNEQAVGLRVQRVETGVEESGRRRRKKNDRRGEAHRTPPIYHPAWLFPSTAKEREKEGAIKIWSRWRQQG